MDFLVSYTAEDRDWAEWIASHLGALGYAYELEEPPSGPGRDPFAAAEEAVGRGEHAIVIVSSAFVEALQTSGAPQAHRLIGPGRAVAVQIEPLVPPADLRDVPTARMQEAADDYAASRDLLIGAVRSVLPQPSVGVGAGGRRVPLPAPVALAEAYPVPAPAPTGPLPGSEERDADRDAAPPSRGDAGRSEPADGDDGAGAPTARSAGLLGVDRADRLHALAGGWGNGRADEAPQDDAEEGVGPGDGARADDEDEGAVGDDRSPTLDEPARSDRLQHLPHPAPVLLWGRDEQLAALGEALGHRIGDDEARTSAGPTSLVLAGPTGIGKTALAAEFAARQAPRLDVTWWVRGASRAMVAADARALARRLGTDGVAGGAAVGHVRRWLEGTEQTWLVVVDGVVDWNDVADLVPASGRGQLVVTTSNPSLVPPADGSRVELAPLEETTAAAFLLACTSRSDQAAARRVAGWSGGTPAALTLAAAWVRGRGRGFDDFLTALDEDGPERLGPLDVSPPVTPVEGAVLAGLRAAESVRPGAARVMTDLAAATADAPLPLDLVAALVATLDAADPAADPSEPAVDALDPALDRALEECGTLAEVLAASGLIVTGGRWAVVPPAVRQALTYLVPTAPSAEGSTRLSAVLGAAAGDPAGPEADAVLPHGARLVGAMPRTTTSTGLARLAALTARWADRHGASAEAVALAERSVDLHSRASGPGDAATRRARRQLAELYRSQGDVARAVPLLETELELPPEAASEDELPLARAAAALAGLLAERADHARAADLAERAAARLAPALGDDHAEVAALRRLRDDSRAEAEADRKEAAGAPEAAEPAAVEPEAAEPEAAEPAAVEDAVAPELETAAEPGAPALGPEPMTGTADDTSGPDGDAASSLDGLLAEVAALEWSAGPSSPEVLAARHRLALAHGEAGRHGEAVALFRQVVADSERVLGPDHPDTLAARSALASAQAEAGDLVAAIASRERVVADHERLLGGDDALTLTARNSLANDYAMAGRYSDALVQQEQVVAGYERTQGEGHPNTLTAQHNLANSYADLGRHDEALRLRERVLERREQMLGPEHPQTLGARNNLANSYADLGQHDRALELRLQVLDQRERVLGPDHPHTLTARNNLANSYAALGRHQEALEMRRRAYDDCVRVLGPDHPHTLTAADNLAGTYAALGRDEPQLDPLNPPTAPAEGGGVGAGAGPSAANGMPAAPREAPDAATPEETPEAARLEEPLEGAATSEAAATTSEAATADETAEPTGPGVSREPAAEPGAAPIDEVLPPPPPIPPELLDAPGPGLGTEPAARPSAATPHPPVAPARPRLDPRGRSGEAARGGRRRKRRFWFWSR